MERTIFFHFEIQSTFMKQATILTKSILQTMLFGIKSAKWIKLKFAVVCLFAFDYLFLNGDIGIHGPGLNYLIFSILLVITSFIIHKKTINDKVYIWSAIALILSATNIVYSRTIWAFTMYFISLLSLIGSMYNNRAHNVIITLMQAFVLQLAHPFNTMFKLLSINPAPFAKSSLSKVGPYFLVPLLLVALFTGLYSLTNQVLANFLQSFTTGGDFFSSFFTLPRILTWAFFFFIFGIFFVSALDNTILTFGDRYTKNLVREEMKKLTKSFPILGLTQELKIGVISLASLNILLALVLSLDLIKFLSSSFDFSASELSKMVHSGTYIVTYTIAASSALVMIFFRKNLNFHPKNGLLIKLSKVWLGLNTLYVTTVGVKNAMYIFDYGLTPKRMSVVIFLGSCLTLLFYSYQKITKKWSISYFLNRFAASACMIILMYSFIDHKAAVVKFASFVQTENIDGNYLSTLCSDRQVLLYNHMDFIEEKTSYPLEFRDRKHYKKEYNSWKAFSYIESQENAFYDTETFKNLPKKETSVY